jgi:hypothetical protein
MKTGAFPCRQLQAAQKSGGKSAAFAAKDDYLTK